MKINYLCTTYLFAKLDNILYLYNYENSLFPMIWWFNFNDIFVRSIYSYRITTQSQLLLQQSNNRCGSLALAQFSPPVFVEGNSTKKMPWRPRLHPFHSLLWPRSEERRVGKGKSVDLGGRRIIKKKKQNKKTQKKTKKKKIKNTTKKNLHRAHTSNKVSRSNHTHKLRH